ncbi:hypothetical protein V6N13_096046 [Hibiscus sabdariffa]
MRSHHWITGHWLSHPATPPPVLSPIAMSITTTDPLEPKPSFIIPTSRIHPFLIAGSAWIKEGDLGRSKLTGTSTMMASGGLPTGIPEI